LHASLQNNKHDTHEAENVLKPINQTPRKSSLGAGCMGWWWDCVCGGEN